MKSDTIRIDGSEGEGGGQMVRSSLALSMLTGTPLEISNIRANRNPPGLKRQHLTCVQAAAQICGAEVSGDFAGSRAIRFHPGPIKGGDYRFDIGTAGSCSLVLQTVALPLTLASQSSTVTVTGGTYNTMAPPFDFLDLAYLPLVRKMGFPIHLQQLEPGFYPRGGGILKLTVEPSSELRALTLLSQSPAKDKRIVSIIAGLPESIAETERSTALRKLGWPGKAGSTKSFARSHSPGNVLLGILEFESLTEVITEFGKQGLPAAKVAARLAREVQAFLKQKVPVGPYLADQLLLPMGWVAAGLQQAGQASQFLTGPLTQHSLTHIQILEQFLPIQIHTSSGDQLSAIDEIPTGPSSVVVVSVEPGLAATRSSGKACVEDGLS